MHELHVEAREGDRRTAHALAPWFFGLVGVVVVDPTANYGLVIAAQLCLFVAALALTVCFVVHAYRSPRVPADKRVLWVVLLLLTGLFTLPVYFWLYIRPA